MIRILSIVALLGLFSAAPLYACKPALPDPHSDALYSDTIFVETVASERALPPIVAGDIVGSNARLTITRTLMVKGKAPANTEVAASSACGGLLPLLHDRMIVIRSGGVNTLRSANSGYERQLRTAIGTAR